MALVLGFKRIQWAAPETRSTEKGKQDREADILVEVLDLCWTEDTRFIGTIARRPKNLFSVFCNTRGATN